MSSFASTRSVFASCTTSSPSTLGGRGAIDDLVPSSRRLRGRRSRRSRRHRGSRARPRATAPRRPSPCIGADGTAASSSSTRFSSARNSKRRKISFSWARSGGSRTSCAGSQSMSRSRRIVASSFEVRAMSACSVMFLRRAGESSSACSITASSEPYWAISWPAVLSPMPGNAGDVVGGVALQPDEVRHLLGRDAVARLDALGRVDVDVGDAARRHHQADVLAAELEGVAVGRDDARLDPLACRRGSRASRSRRPPPSPRTRGCGSRTPRRSGGSAGTARAAGPASAAGPSL